MSQDPKALKDVRMQYNEDGQIWRLVKEDRHGETEEIVFTMTGALWATDLPPITREMMNMKDKACFLSQSVKVTGIGGESFGHTVAALKEICQTGEREFKEGELQQWNPKNIQGFEVVDVSNRYFRPKAKTAEDTGIELAQEIDPNGILRRAANNTLIHTDDNVVYYYKVVIEDGKKWYSKARLQIFRIGDVVEVQCSVAFIKARNTTAQMKLVLRAVAMVNCQHAMNTDREKKRMAAEAGEPKSTSKMKRKIEFEDDDEKGESESNEGPGKRAKTAMDGEAEDMGMQ